MPDDDIWYFWNIFILIFAMLESMLYPYFTAQGFPENYLNPSLVLLYLCQIVFTIDIILNFFLALKVKGDESDYILHIEKIGINYLKTNFLRDLLLTLPLGMVSYFIPRLKILYLVKSVRIERFFKFFKPSFFMP